ncbi:outer membrane protein [Flaviaesturariibacter aridisoli]|uniref:Outer membrane protein beta-barrel domain-containing protein n=1 Tax=Flaviaesturariibacter aridisoli TaxID=2545761 RepID=A0A4R4E3S6_9BACT|nr:outer membrane beta-barrel protein [Flaviaesturariibacter aridisoli]TCZ70988.1 hypothetical protein E0486_10205 [Flaviaesturariibacter aridisoli]
MKKIALFSAGLLSVAAVNAQLNKGRIFLGGSITSSSTENTTVNNPNNIVTKQSAFVIDPTIGVFAKENLVVGINVGFSKAKTEAAGNTQQEQRTIAPGVFLRRYYPLGKSFFFYGHGGLNYINQKSETFNGTTPVNEVNGNGFGLTIFPGVAYAIRKNFLLEVSLRNLLTANYVSSEIKNPNNIVTAKTNTFNLGVNGGGGVPLSIGFNILLGK